MNYTIDYFDIVDGIYYRKQIEYKDGLLFMRMKKRAIEKKVDLQNPQ